MINQSIRKQRNWFDDECKKANTESRKKVKYFYQETKTGKGNEVSRQIAGIKKVKLHK